MYSLLIDTHSNIIRLCLYKNDEVVEYKEIESVMHHSDFLMPNIKSLLSNNNISKNELNEVLVINGPGSFTGVRLGVTVAKMLAYTLNIKIKVLTSLDMFAYSDEKENKIVSIPDVKGFYVGKYINNALDSDYMYLSKDEYEKFVNNEEFDVIDNIVNYKLIKKVFNDKNSINPHIVNPVYIKLIEALK